MTSNWHWTAYQVILRLHSPLHIGRGSVSYLQRTHPYVTGRVLRGALVNRVGRNQNIRGEDWRDPFRCVSKTFAQFLTFTYFYPALKKGDVWKAAFPWEEDEANFRRRFLSSYTSTALSYPSQSAEEGSLHEIEFISPRTLDTGDPVYLMGYVFVEEQRLKLENYDWKAAFKRLQLGGERGYGWGDVRLAYLQSKESHKLFGEIASPILDKRWPVLHLDEDAHLLAHTKAENESIKGQIEPVVGREWRDRKQIGRHLAYDGVFFAPGSLVTQKSDFSIREAGYWHPKLKLP